MTQEFTFASVYIGDVEEGDHVQHPLGTVFKVKSRTLGWNNGQESTWTLTSADGSLEVKGGSETRVNKAIQR